MVCNTLIGVFGKWNWVRFRIYCFVLENVAFALFWIHVYKTFDYCETRPSLKYKYALMMRIEVAQEWKSQLRDI